MLYEPKHYSGCYLFLHCTTTILQNIARNCFDSVQVCFSGKRKTGVKIQHDVFSLERYYSNSGNHLCCQRLRSVVLWHLSQALYQLCYYGLSLKENKTFFIATVSQARSRPSEARSRVGSADSGNKQSFILFRR